MNKYTVAIVGTGPAAMFAALELTRLAPGVSVAMFEKGKIRSAQEASSTRVALDAGERVNVTEGWGGAGAFSDGKFNLDESGRVGGRLVGDGLVTRDVYARLLHEAAQIYVDYGADSDRTYGIRDESQRPAVNELKRLAAGKDLEIHEFPIMHLGTSNAHKIVENMRHELERRGVTIFAECKVDDLARDGNDWRVITTTQGEFHCEMVIVCPGRSGSNLFIPVLQRNGVRIVNNGIDIGVRVETSMDVMRHLTDMFYELKLYHWGRDQVRSFCMCPNGRVAVEEYRDTGIFCANGHTDPAHPSTNCNFAVLVTQRFTAPFNDPLGYAVDIAGQHTKLAGGGVLVQRLGDLREERRSKPSRMAKGRIEPTCTDRVEPGNIDLAMPGRFTRSIVRFLDAMAVLAPGVASDHTLLYAPEIKFNATLVAADPARGFEALPGLHVAGDGVGYTRGLNGASVQGMIVGRWIAENLNN